MLAISVPFTNQSTQNAFVELRENLLLFLHDFRKAEKKPATDYADFTDSRLCAICGISGKKFFTAVTGRDNTHFGFGVPAAP
jgi:hypothetical protein